MIIDRATTQLLSIVTEKRVGKRDARDENLCISRDTISELHDKKQKCITIRKPIFHKAMLHNDRLIKYEYATL